MKSSQSNWVVRVECMTYNHALFIEDTMNGFTMQQTTFPFLCTILDDASTDEEQDVIKRYMEEHFDLSDLATMRREETSAYSLIFARHNQNLNCFFAVLFLKYNHYSIKKDKKQYLDGWGTTTKYIATCEGDDYWTDPHKLQRQVGFLEQHPDYTFVAHDNDIYLQDKGTWIRDQRGSLKYDFFDGYQLQQYNLDNYFNLGSPQLLTTVYRNGDYLQQIPKNKYNYYRDTIFFYYLLREGKGAILKDNMGVYRKHENGIYSGKSDFYNFSVNYKNCYDIFIIEQDANALHSGIHWAKRAIYTALANKEYMSIVLLLKKLVYDLPLKDSVSLFKDMIRHILRH